MIRAILLDLGRVIVPFDFSIGYQALQSYCDASPEVIRERIRNTGLIPEFESGRIESRDFVERLCSATGVTVDYARFCEIWTSIFARETLISEPFLKQLHAKYRLVLVSNTNAIHFEMIRETYPLLRHFDGFVLSYQVKAMKPAPAIFDAAIQSSRCAASECFFTDDIAEYVEGAKACGIDAVLFENFEQLQRELHTRGVTWDD